MAESLFRHQATTRLTADDLHKKVIGGIAIANEFWEYVSGGSIAIVTLQSETKIIISDETGFTISTIIFRASQDCDSWEARADGNGNPGVGLLVGSGGSIIANNNIQFDIDYTELTNGDKTYPIDVFAHNSAGWSSRT